jgi:hypothetical protein
MTEKGCVSYTVNNELKIHLVMVPPDKLVGDFLKLIQEKQKRPDLCAVYFDDSVIRNEDPLYDWWDGYYVFRVTNSRDGVAWEAAAPASVIQEGIPPDEFTFTINHKAFPTSIDEAVLLSPAVGEQLQVDACARRFDICASGIDSTGFSSLQSLLSGKEVIVQKSHQKSLIRLSQQLLNVGFERLFSGLWSDCSTVDAAVTLSSAFAAHSCVYLQSVSDVSLLSVDALDSLLSSESFMVDSEDAFCKRCFRLGIRPFFATSGGNL